MCLDGFADNIVASSSPNLLGLTLEQVVEERRRTLEASPALVLHSVERGTLGGREAVWLEVRGIYPGQVFEIQQRIALVLHEDEMVEFAVTAYHDRWTARLPTFESTVSGLQWL